MSITTATIDWLANTRNYATAKFRTPRKAPGFVAAEVGNDIMVDAWSGFSDERRMHVAARISWVYANIMRIANEVSAADFTMYKRGSKEEDLDHELEELLAQPNEFFDGRTLLKYTIWGLSLDQWGAFWNIARDSRTGAPREIWPIPIGRCTPVKDKNQFIRHYIYTANNGEKLPMKKEDIVRFIYPHPENIWKSFPPLEAAGLALEVYTGVTKAQRDMFVQSRGTPLSILSLDPNISASDFAVARQRIRDDWASEQRVAIVRAGTLNSQVVGLSNRDLQVIEAQQFTRDEIDSVFMNGLQWHQTGAGYDLEEMNKAIKDTVIYPVNLMLAAQIQTQLITPNYGKEYRGQFTDVRAQDRSLALQERTIYFRSMGLDETRAELGKPPWKSKLLPDYGELPYSLASNPAFITSYYELGAVKDPEADPPDVGNLEDSQDSELVVEDASGGANPQETGIEEGKTFDLGEALTEGMAVELKRYRKVLQRVWKNEQDPEALLAREFTTSVIPANAMASITEKLGEVEEAADIKAIFDEWLQ